MDTNKKNTQSTQTTQTIQSFKPSNKIKKKGCGCGKKTSK
ncbi:hypothetical protein QFZ87_004127 [Bacillus sp. SLBN-46]|nr:hypothetical protein [Bacillus sp. SLBN-46]